ncbi:IS110 family transposase [Actinomadura sp. 9N215]|uniref:IS110 family transposase n=1 Tax=Actinomadura sp. 9N215 TaxID=3375150 RepID=UPI0037A82183
MLPESQLALGVDTHKDVNVAVLLDALGRKVATAAFATTDRGNAELAEWVQQYGEVVRAGVEGTGSYGHRLSCRLMDQGIGVIEVNRPDRSRRRRKGKSDSVDAEAAARAVLAGEASAVPKDRSGPVGELRSLLLARRSAIKARTQANNQLRALVHDLHDEMRERLDQRRPAHRARACAALSPDNGTFKALGVLGRRWLMLHQEIQELEQSIVTLVRETVPNLLARPGIGPITAAQLLVTAGDNPDRLRTEASFAALCGVSPIEHSSGRCERRRLNLGGDRVANSALWIIAHVRLVHDPRTQQYGAKRTTEGKDRKDILRRLQRYIAREVYRDITFALSPPVSSNPPPDTATTA